MGQLTAFSISGHQVARFLCQIGESRGLPKVVTVDNGTEFTSKAMHFWSEDAGVRLGLIQPGKPTQNAFVESLNGKFRNECLNPHWFRSLDEAKQKIDQWRQHYNEVRPHSSLGYVPPVEFAKKRLNLKNSHSSCGATFGERSRRLHTFLIHKRLRC